MNTHHTLDIHFNAVVGRVRLRRLTEEFGDFERVWETKLGWDVGKKQASLEISYGSQLNPEGVARRLLCFPFVEYITITLHSAKAQGVIRRTNAVTVGKSPLRGLR